MAMPACWANSESIRTCARVMGAPEYRLSAMMTPQASFFTIIGQTTNSSAPTVSRSWGPTQGFSLASLTVIARPSAVARTGSCPASSVIEKRIFWTRELSGWWSLAAQRSYAAANSSRVRG